MDSLAHAKTKQYGGYRSGRCFGQGQGSRAERLRYWLAKFPPTSPPMHPADGFVRIRGIQTAALKPNSENPAANTA